MTQRSSHSALDLCASYVSALSERDADTVAELRSPDCITDFVHLDAFEGGPVGADEAHAFWRSWFAAFGELELEVSRTFAAADAVVMEWDFTLTNDGPLQPPVVAEPLPATGRTITFRGVAVLDVAVSQITRETVYFDYATLWTELGGSA